MSAAEEVLDAARGHRRPEQIVAAELRHVRDLGSDTREEPPPEGASEASPKTLGYSFADALSKPLATTYCIKDFARPGEITVLFGDSGALKSFVAVDAALHYAAALRQWLGHRVRRKGGALFILGEGSGGFPKRLKVWAMEHGLSDLPAYVYPAPVDLFEGPGDLQRVIEQAELAVGCAVCFVVIDPLGVMFGGGDESKNTDVAQVFSNVRMALGDERTALVIHHVGHSDKGRERGASTIRTNADARFLVEYQESTNIVTVEHLKEKEGPRGQSAYLTARVIVLGTDDDGDPISSLVLAPTSERPAEVTEWKGAVKQSDQRALQVLGPLWVANMKLPVPTAAWRQELHRLGMLPEKEQPDDSVANRKAFQRMAKLLREAGLVEQNGSGKSVTYNPATPGVASK